MILLLTIVTLDCIVSYYFIGILGAEELNPIVLYMMDSVGVGYALLIKWIGTAVVLGGVALLGWKTNKLHRYNRFCHIGAMVYIALFVIGGICF